MFSGITALHGSWMRTTHIKELSMAAWMVLLAPKLHTWLVRDLHTHVTHARCA